MLTAVENLPIQSEVLEEYVAYVVTNESPAMMWAGILMAVTASSAAFRALMRGERGDQRAPGLSGAGHVRRQFRHERGAAAHHLCLFGGHGHRPVVSELDHRRFPLDAVVWAWQWLRFPILFALGVLALSAIYRVCMNRKAMPDGRAWPGAVFASVALVIGTGVFSLFISLSSRYSLVYGSLASVIILLLWLFICANILVLGNVVNYALALERKGGDGPLLPGDRAAFLKKRP